MSARIWSVVLLGIVFFELSGSAYAQQLAPPAAADQTIVLDTSGYWRAYYMLSPPVVRDGQQLTKLRTLTGQTPPPPANWTAPDFDDRAWARTPGRPFPSGRYWETTDSAILDAGVTSNEHTSPALALICLRGKFTVTDPAAGRDLKLALKYRGGAVVYVNGKEIGRATLTAGSTGPDVLAADYPKEAFFRDDGTLAGVENRGKPQSDLPAWKARVRATEIAIPAEALRPGVNVLAIEVHRSAFPADVQKWLASKRVPSYEIGYHLWATCGVLSVRLSAASPVGLTPNCARPAGMQVWNSQLLQSDFDVDYGDRNEPLQPIHIAGSRGGVFNGKVVVGSDQPIKGLMAQMSDLVSAPGAPGLVAGSAAGSRIPASSIKVRYAIPSGSETVMPGRYPVTPDLLDGLADTAPPVIAVRNHPVKANAPWIAPGQPDWIFGAVCPVWVTVAVPDNATPGVHCGKLTVTAEGLKPTEVAVELSVAAWHVPKPGAFHTIVDLIQSPESVALQYHVPLYSDEHFKLLEKSLDRLGYVGNWTLNVPIICQTNLGNEQSMVRWVKKPDGSYTYDFAVMDRYLDLAEKHMGRPRILFLAVWDFFLGETGVTHSAIQASIVAPEEVPVSLLDPATGQVTMTTVGRYDEKGKPAWKALVAQLREHLRQRGLDKAVVLGTADDVYPTPEIIEFWHDLWPEASWGRYSHFELPAIGKTGRPWAFQAAARFQNALADVTGARTSNYGWRRPDQVLLYFRTNYNRTVVPWWSMPWDTSRLLGEISTQGPMRGFGRVGLDFWPVLKDGRGQQLYNIQGRYPKSQWLQLDAMIKCLVPPGPDGAMATGKLELMREGLQENEARILVENALLDPALKAKLPAPLAARCQQVLDERIAALTVTLEEQETAGFGLYRAWLDGFGSGDYRGVNAAIFRQWYMESGWQERSQKLFDVASEVAAAVK